MTGDTVLITSPLRAGRTEWIGLAVITLPCLLYPMDLTVLHLALPRLSAELIRPSSAELLWIIDIYGFMVAGSRITMGTLGDQFGRRRLLLPEYRDLSAGCPDVLSAALSLVAVLGVGFGLKQIAQDGFDWQPALVMLAGLVAGVAFVRRQLQLADPQIDLRLFQVPAFSASLVLYGLGIFILFGGLFFGPQYLQLVLGLSPLEAALWSLPGAVASILGIHWFRRADAAGRDHGDRAARAGNVTFSLGIAPLFTLRNELIIGSAPPARAGAASRIAETCAELGGGTRHRVLRLHWACRISRRTCRCGSSRSDQSDRDREGYARRDGSDCGAAPRLAWRSAGGGGSPGVYSETSGVGDHQCGGLAGTCCLYDARAPQCTDREWRRALDRHAALGERQPATARSRWLGDGNLMRGQRVVRALALTESVRLCASTVAGQAVIG